MFTLVQNKQTKVTCQVEIVEVGAAERLGIGEIGRSGDLQQIPAFFRAAARIEGDGEERGARDVDLDFRRMRWRKRWKTLIENAA